MLAALLLEHLLAARFCREVQLEPGPQCRGPDLVSVLPLSLEPLAKALEHAVQRLLDHRWALADLAPVPDFLELMVPLEPNGRRPFLPNRLLATNVWNFAFLDTSFLIVLQSSPNLVSILRLNWGDAVSMVAPSI
jgi:hypothetical protein